MDLENYLDRLTDANNDLADIEKAIEEHYSQPKPKKVLFDYSWQVKMYLHELTYWTNFYHPLIIGSEKTTFEEEILIDQINDLNPFEICYNLTFFEHELLMFITDSVPLNDGSLTTFKEEMRVVRTHRTKGRKPKNENLVLETASQMAFLFNTLVKCGAFPDGNKTQIAKVFSALTGFNETNTRGQLQSKNIDKEAREKMTKVLKDAMNLIKDKNYTGY